MYSSYGGGTCVHCKGDFHFSLTHNTVIWLLLLAVRAWVKVVEKVEVKVGDGCGGMRGEVNTWGEWVRGGGGGWGRGEYLIWTYTYMTMKLICLFIYFYSVDSSILCPEADPCKRHGDFVCFLEKK